MTTTLDLAFALAGLLLYRLAPTRYTRTITATLVAYCVLEATLWRWMESTVARFL